VDNELKEEMVTEMAKLVRIHTVIVDRRILERGFRTYEAMGIALYRLYHTLGRLPESESTHRFC